MKSYNNMLASFVLLTMFLSGCGSSGSTTAASGTGSVSAKLVWNNEKAIGKSVASAPVGVVTVRLAMSGLQKDFPASSGIGQIDNVPVGSGLKLTAMGLNASGTLTHQGAVENVAILDGQTTDVGTVIMNPVTSTLSAITVTASTNTSLAIGATRQLTATGTYSDSTTKDLTSVVTWSSSSDSVATISPSGMASAVAAGTTTISATSGTITGTTTLVVPGSTMVITVTPANTNVPVGFTKQFTATATYPDGTTKDLTTLATWSSSNPSVATISTGGMASAVAFGTSTIQATYSAVSGTALLTVIEPTSGSSNGIYSY